MGMRPGRRNAIAAGMAEAGGGTALALGAATPLAASALTATMLTAIYRVHLKNGIWAGKGGYEYNAVLIAAVMALVEFGPGELSLDAKLSHKEWGTGWALAALGAGMIGALGAHFAAEAQPEAPADEPGPPAEAVASNGQTA